MEAKLAADKICYISLITSKVFLSFLQALVTAIKTKTKQQQQATTSARYTKKKLIVQAKSQSREKLQKTQASYLFINKRTVFYIEVGNSVE